VKLLAQHLWRDLLDVEDNMWRCGTRRQGDEESGLILMLHALDIRALALRRESSLFCACAFLCLPVHAAPVFSLLSSGLGRQPLKNPGWGLDGIEHGRDPCRCTSMPEERGLSTFGNLLCLFPSRQGPFSMLESDVRVLSAPVTGGAIVVKWS